MAGRRYAVGCVLGLLASLSTASCGDDGSGSEGLPPGLEPGEVAKRIVQAVERRDARALYKCVRMPAGRRIVASDIRAMEATLSEAEDVTFAPGEPGAAAGHPPRVVVPVEILCPERTEAKGETALTLTQRRDRWRLMPAGLQAFLDGIFEVTTGLCAEERRSWNAMPYVESALLRYAADHEGALPGSIEDLLPGVQGGEGYLATMPRDGWGRRLRLRINEDDTYDLRSAGPDGRFETADDLIAE